MLNIIFFYSGLQILIHNGGHMIEDRHVIETLGKVRVVIENGEITEVGESEMKYCPMFQECAHRKG